MRSWQPERLLLPMFLTIQLWQAFLLKSSSPSTQSKQQNKFGKKYLQIHHCTKLKIMGATKTSAEGATAMKTKNVKAFGTEAAAADLQQLNIRRRYPTPHDVEIDILYCGVCHSDLHTARNEWHGTIYPCVPGHEIVGKIISVGDHVKKFRV